MTDSSESPKNANPYSSEGGDNEASNPTTSSSGVGARPDIDVRMWPALLIIGLMWFLIIVPGKIVPLTLIHFLSMQLGPPVCTIALAVWWLLSRRVSLRQRWLGLAVIVSALIAMIFFGHSSMSIVLLIYGIASSLTILLLGLRISASKPWESRRKIALAGFAIFIASTFFFRVGQMDAAFAFSLVPRWTPTAEDEFLAGLQQETAAASSESTGIEFPEEPEAGDWAEFRGTRRDGILRDVRFGTDWSSNPPKELWRKSVGPGWSAFCVVGQVAFTQEQRGDQEAVVAYRVSDGSQLWATSIPARFSASMGGIGPRATPTYAGGKLYVTGGTGVIQSLDAATGESIWKYDLVNELTIKTPEWGFSSSPLVVDDIVVVFASGGESKAVVALDRTEGTLRWSASDGYHAYGSPQLSTIDGQQHIVISSNLGLRGLSKSDGSILWQHDWDIGQMARVTQPLVIGNAVYQGTGYGNGTLRVNVRHNDQGWDVEESWTAPLKPYFNDFVHYEGNLYGFDDSIFTCIDAETGDRNWKRGRYGFGQVLLIEKIGVLLVLSEKGDIVLLNANPQRHEEIAKIHSLEGVTWNHPVVANGKLFVRNAEEAVCYALPDFEMQSANPAE